MKLSKLTIAVLFSMTMYGSLIAGCLKCERTSHVVPWKCEQKNSGGNSCVFQNGYCDTVGVCTGSSGGGGDGGGSCSLNWWICDPFAY